MFTVRRADLRWFLDEMLLQARDCRANEIITIVVPDLNAIGAWSWCRFVRDEGCQCHWGTTREYGEGPVQVFLLLNGYDMRSSRMMRDARLRTNESDSE